MKVRALKYAVWSEDAETNAVQRVLAYFSSQSDAAEYAKWKNEKRSNRGNPIVYGETVTMCYYKEKE